MRTLLTRLAVALVLAVGVGVTLVAPASAHDVLISSDPSDGATLKSVPTSLSFTFDQPVQNFDPVVSLVGPDGKQYATGTPSVSGNVVTGPIGTGPAGAYTGAYRIVSADGHPVTGEIHFTMSVSGTATGTSGSGAGTAAPAPSSGGLSAGLWAALGVAALILVAAAVVLLRRSRSPRPAGSRDY